MDNPSKSVKALNLRACRAELAGVDFVANPAFPTWEDATLDYLSLIPNLGDKVDRLVDIMQGRQGSTFHRMKAFGRVHNTIICYHRGEQGLAFMVTQHAQTGLWGLGGDYLYQYQEYKKDLAEYFQIHYGMDIQVEADPKYDNNTPYVVGTYTAQDGAEALRGTLFLAQMNQPPRWLRGTPYSQMRLITPAEIDSVDLPWEPGVQDYLRQCVDYFQ